jgi:hypothetical protein
MSELTPEELEQLEGELLPKREALSVIGPLPAEPGTDAAELAELAETEEPSASDET